MIRTFIKCPICGKDISKSNTSNHERTHENGNYEKYTKQKYVLDHDDLLCKFCGKETKNKNSLINHEMRCPKNQNRINVIIDGFNMVGKPGWSKGKTKETCEVLRKRSEKITGRKRIVIYKHIDHNQNEINKWLNYIKNKDFYIPPYELSSTNISNESYLTLKGMVFIGGRKHRAFEHEYIANILLDGGLLPEHTVHHIDENKHNNNISNLMIFENDANHKRFHLSNYAWLIYDEKTHLFRCIIKKTD